MTMDYVTIHHSPKWLASGLTFVAPSGANVSRGLRLLQVWPWSLQTHWEWEISRSQTRGVLLSELFTDV
jgi:hypothetical protein